MRKTTLILAFLAVVACCGAQTGSSFYCDTTGISIFNALVNGKFMPATLVYCSEDKHDLTYDLSLPFMENDTNTAKCFTDTFPEDAPVMFAEEMPEFPGGPDSLKAFLRQNLKWPIEYGCWNGTVLVEFIVEVDGSITHPRVEVSLYKDFDEEAIRVIKLMPKWKPARAQGKTVRCYYKIPVTFSM